MKDFYAILGVAPTAPVEVIRAAYRALAKMYHPDNGETGNRKKFEACKEAYDILTDEAKRAVYDSVSQGNGNGPEQPQGRTVWMNGRGWVPTNEAGPFPGDFPPFVPPSSFGQMHTYGGQPAMDEMVQDMAGRLAHDALDQILQNLLRRRR
jgi:DnaJ-class molecular chaperone